MLLSTSLIFIAGLKAALTDIDDIFSNARNLKKNKEKKRREKSKKKERNLKMIRPDSPKPVRFTDDGLPIYTEESLKVGLSGGDTELCPFDCDCCF